MQELVRVMYLWVADVWFHVQGTPKFNLLVDLSTRTCRPAEPLELNSKNVGRLVNSELLQSSDFLPTMTAVILVITFQSFYSSEAV